MKHPCELIQDLLPLYEEDLCSPASREAVEAHLAQCPACRRLTRAMPQPEVPDTPAADRAVARGIRHTRRRWLASLVLVALLLPLAAMGFNQYRGSGLCFTNLDEFHTARNCAAALEEGDWLGLAQRMDFSEDYDSILEALRLTVQDMVPAHTAVEIDGEIWYLREGALTVEIQPTLAETVYALVSQTREPVMFPPELLDALWAMEPPEFIRELQQTDPQQAQEILTELDREAVEFLEESYVLTDTPWGTYYLPNGLGQPRDAARMAQYLALVPEAVYLAAVPQLEAEARENYESTHNSYGYVADMTQAEFAQYMEETYAAELAQLPRMGITIQNGGYHSSYRNGDGWTFRFRATVTQDGNAHHVQLDVYVSGQTLKSLSVSARENTRWLDDLNQLLFPSAHPDF